LLKPPAAEASLCSGRQRNARDRKAVASQGRFSPPDPPDIRRIAILQVTLSFPDAGPAVTPAVAGKRIVRSVEQTTTNAALSCVPCHGLVFRPFSMESTELGRLML
jgi:hypothetical protein